ncbi:MAG: hypothetical protein JHC38_04285 [Thiotrichales bacterium]|nr:hypothetical protein [Thiotrichales bacterium]
MPDMLPPRSRRYVGHDGRIPRELTLSPITLIFGLVLLLGVLVLVFPKESLLTRIFQADLNDSLTRTYLENLVRLEPNNVALKGLYLKSRLPYLSWQQLVEETTPIIEHGSHEEKQLIVPILLKKLAQEQNKSQTLLQTQRRLLLFAFEPGWQADTLEAMLTQALALHEQEIAQRIIPIWLNAQPTNPTVFLEKEAKQALGLGYYQQSAMLYFQIQAISHDQNQQKSAFMQAIAILVAGGFHQEALTAIDAHVGNLLTDEDVLRYLIKVAQAAGQPKRASLYARLLLNMSLVK